MRREEKSLGRAGDGRNVGRRVTYGVPADFVPDGDLQPGNLQGAFRRGSWPLRFKLRMLVAASVSEFQGR